MILTKKNMMTAKVKKKKKGKWYCIKLKSFWSSMVGQVCNSSTWEAKAERFCVRD
jgi:hypothetical protein